MFQNICNVELVNVSIAILPNGFRLYYHVNTKAPNSLSFFKKNNR